jgi:hypothetical protein
MMSPKLKKMTSWRSSARCKPTSLENNRAGLELKIAQARKGGKRF